MFGIGTGELLLLMVLALIVLGPARLPQLARDLGKTLADLRKSSDELREEFLNADKVIERAAALPQPAGPPDAGATQATVATGPEVAAEDSGTPMEDGSDESAQDREGREARQRLEDPERQKKAAAEGWKVPEERPGPGDRWG